MLSNVSMGIPICPITQEAMIDPVIDHEGHSYERTAILSWIAENNNSPITRNPLSNDDLKPNRALFDIIKFMNSLNIEGKNNFMF